VNILSWHFKGSNSGVNLLQVNEIFDQITSVLGEGSVARDVPMRSCTSMKVGGNADFVVMPGSAQKLFEIIKAL
jgi:hypothetical protein